MLQTPIHDHHNPELLSLIPPTAARLIEIGCSSGALAREFKKINPICDYLGVDIDPAYAELARQHCDSTLSLDLDQADTEFFAAQRERDCWVFGDTLEHLRDPWRVLRSIRAVLPAHGCVVACIPNAQHWSLIAKLSAGDFRYVDAGLLDRTHLRWFTRETILELFRDCGFRVVTGVPRIFAEPIREQFLPLIGALAKAYGADMQQAINDAQPLQYVLRAAPV